MGKKRIWKDSNLVTAGTPDTIIREINRYLNIGVTYFTVWFPDLPDTRSNSKLVIVVRRRNNIISFLMSIVYTVF
ncbi:MAG: hypothetical protein M3P08_15645 [Thermoproteota archaeon]|nr:hypothetical protein [Thermoproteota archaeon]